MDFSEVDTSELNFTKIHDCEAKFYDGKITVSYRVMKMERMLWIWLGTNPCLTNLSFHVSNKNVDTMPSAIRVIEADGNDYCVGLGNRISRKVEGSVVHIASHIPAGMRYLSSCVSCKKQKKKKKKQKYLVTASLSV